MSRAFARFILTRLALMVPTGFAILLICFLILNLVPGRPGQAGETESGGGTEEARAQYRLFKETFNYDRPVLFNTDFWVERDEVRALLDASQLHAGDAAVRLEATHRLEDLGPYIVEELLEIMNHDSARRRAAMRQLAVNAQRRNLYLGREDQIPPELREAQREVVRHNRMVSTWAPADADTEEQLEALQAQWNAWYLEHKPRFELSAADKWHAFFFDTRFAAYFGALLRGELGFTVYRRPVLAELLPRLKVSMILGALSLTLIFLIAVPLGTFAAIRRDRWEERGMTLLLFVLYSLPTFFVGTLLVEYIPNGQPLYTAGFETARVVAPDASSWQRLQDIALHLVLPVFCLSYGGLASMSRYARSGLLEVINADYVRTARAKGLPESLVIVKHALRNGVMPLVTMMGLLLPVLFSGSIVVETIFEIDGIGRYMWMAIQMRDYSVIMAGLLLTTLATLVGTLLADLAYAWLDPRIALDGRVGH
ncbi:MAG: ABC transporter permease [Myxococcota bacterium]|jgi:peptide/nickel transport system permease protein|nr:ABC transporter permease [Myxococcota bacterium]